MPVHNNQLQKSVTLTEEALARLSAEAEHIGRENLTKPPSIAEMIRRCVSKYDFKASEELYLEELAKIKEGGAP